MDAQTIPKLLNLIVNTQSRIHSSIIQNEENNRNKIIQLQSDYLTITNDFSNSYYTITKNNKPAKDIDNKITQYLAEIKHSYTNIDITTVDGYILAFTNFFDDLNKFASSIN